MLSSALKSLYISTEIHPYSTFQNKRIKLIQLIFSRANGYYNVWLHFFTFHG